ncbi:hypothetical protein F4779DRAFT_378120 [Xylariaceae sp. FL0662B]|nr:hypothetical protein F4779DRAFT_378120 [Xylariaceae sp. FL0662B]
MTNSETKSWWRTHVMHPPPARYSPPICPCLACYEGIGHDREVGMNSRVETKSIPIDKYAEKHIPKTAKNVYKLAEKPRTASIASDSVPLRLAAQSTPRISSDSLAVTSVSSTTG